MDFKQFTEAELKQLTNVRFIGWNGSKQEFHYQDANGNMVGGYVQA